MSYNKAEAFLFSAEQHKAYFSSRPKINGPALLEYKIKKITRYINNEDSGYAFANKHCLFAISKTKLREEDG